jgi:hypothetical protein
MPFGTPCLERWNYSQGFPNFFNNKHKMFHVKFPEEIYSKGLLLKDLIIDERRKEISCSRLLIKLDTSLSSERSFDQHKETFLGSTLLATCKTYQKFQRVADMIWKAKLTFVGGFPESFCPMKLCLDREVAWRTIVHHTSFLHSAMRVQPNGAVMSDAQGDNIVAAPIEKKYLGGVLIIMGVDLGVFYFWRLKYCLKLQIIKH